MWPILLDMTKVDCKRMLRRLELEAYGNLVSALRAQGRLSSEKHKLLQEISSTLNIPQERHRAEIRRAVNDERLATIAYCMTGDDTTDEWALEGRRLVPLMPRMVPQTAYSVIADDEANKASLENEKLPVPSSTERKRPLQNSTSEPNKNIHFPTSEFASKHANQCINEDGNIKKRKTNVNVESSTLAQHLIMGPPKISRVQQLYRQKTKAVLKQQMKQRAPSTQHITNIQKAQRKGDEDIKPVPHAQMSVQRVPTENKNVNTQTVATNTVTVTVSNENVATQSKISTVQPSLKPSLSNSNTVKVQQAPIVVNATEITSKSIKICPARKVMTATSRAQNQSQKLIIVSNSQGNTTSSILQRTLTIPFVKTISMKSLDKLKVISNTSSSSTTSVTTSVANQKPKLLTVHTKMKSNASGKHLNIPFIQGVQLQALQNKGAIKMVPLSTSTKITSKPTVISAVTSSNTSPIMSTKPQTSVDNNQDNQRNVYIIKNEDIKPTVSVITDNSENTNNQNVVVLNVQQKVEQKSSVLTEILKASGVIPNDDSESLSNDETEMSQEQCDIETQISQLTAIPNSEEDSVSCSTDMCEVVQNAEIEMIDEVQESQAMEQYNNGDVSSVPETSVEESDFIVLQGPEDTNMLVCELEDEPQKPNSDILEVMGSLDPETGMYSIQESAEDTGGLADSEDQNSCNSYVIEMESVHSSELDMPTLGLN